MSLVKYYIPSKKKDGSEIEYCKREVYKSLIVNALTLNNGGATEYKATGYYRGEGYKIIKENVIVIESFGDSLKDIDFKYWCDHLQQETLAYSVDGEIYLNGNGKGSADRIINELVKRS